MTAPLLVLGAGGHARVLLEALRAAGEDVLGVAAPAPHRIGERVGGAAVLGDDDWLLQRGAEGILLVNGLGSIGLTGRRRELFLRYKEAGFAFAAVIHPSAVVASDVELEEGAQVMAGVVLQPGCRLGRNALVNTRASVDHDCQVGEHAHLAPGVTLSGNVRIGAGCHVGTGATVIQGVTIGAGSLVGAGAVVVGDVPSGASVMGVPARVRER